MLEIANEPQSDTVHRSFSSFSCGGELVIRKDDAPETVKSRLAIYHETTEVLKDYYAAQNKLRLVEGNQSIEGAFKDILKALGETV